MRILTPAFLLLRDIFCFSDWNIFLASFVAVVTNAVGRCPNVENNQIMTVTWHFNDFFFLAIRADNDIQWQPAFRMYRGMFLFVLEFFFFGINLYGWKSVGINPAHICDLKNSLCPLRMLEVRFVRCTREFSKPPSPPPSMTPFWSPADSKQTLYLKL